MRAKLALETANGTLLVSTDIRDANGKLIAELVRNEWKVAPPPGTWDRNYNSNTLEVKNDSGRIVLQVRLLADRVQIQGEWLATDGRGVRIVTSDIPNMPGGLIIKYGPGIATLPTNPPFVKPLFKYPSELHFGELILQ